MRCVAANQEQHQPPHGSLAPRQSPLQRSPLHVWSSTCCRREAHCSAVKDNLDCERREAPHLRIAFGQH
eukprot:14760230-Heterocapsa_arctica.AAC.1